MVKIQEIKSENFSMNHGTHRPGDTIQQGFVCGGACTNGMVCGAGCGHGVGSACGLGCSRSRTEIQ